MARAVMGPWAGSSELGALVGVVQAMLGRLSTATIVRVVDCTNSGELKAVGTVSVQPLVSMVDGDGLEVRHGVLYEVPYLRLQGGKTAFIVDPEPGDVGVVLFADRDIAAAIRTKTAGPPQSGRRFDMSDGIYFGVPVADTPEQYVRASADGLEIKSPTEIKLDAPSIQISAQSVQVNSPTVSFSGAVTANSFSAASSLKVAGKELKLHVHPGNGQPQV